MSEVISRFKSLRAGSQVFARFMLLYCVIIHVMWSVKSMQLLCILPIGLLCLSAISMMVKKNYVGWYCGLSKSGLCVFRKLCLVSFLVVGESPSVLLWSIVVSYVNCGDGLMIVHVELSAMSDCTVCQTRWSYLVKIFVVVWCLALWLVCLYLIVCGPSC